MKNEQKFFSFVYFCVKRILSFSVSRDWYATSSPTSRAPRTCRQLGFLVWLIRLVFSRWNEEKERQRKSISHVEMSLAGRSWLDWEAEKSVAQLIFGSIIRDAIVTNTTFQIGFFSYTKVLLIFLFLLIYLNQRKKQSASFLVVFFCPDNSKHSSLVFN